MSDHDESDDEQWIGRVLTGEVALGDARVQRALRANPRRLAEVQQLLGFAHELDALREDAPALGAPSVPSAAEERIADMVRTTLGASAHAPRKGPSWRWAVAAAAAIAIAFIVLREDSSPAIAPPWTTLGPGEIWPNGPTTRAELSRHGFRWEAPSTAAEFMLTFAAPGADIAPVRVADVSSWMPDADFVARLPQSFTWTVRAQFPGRPAWTRTATLVLAP